MLSRSASSAKESNLDMYSFLELEPSVFPNHSSAYPDGHPPPPRSSGSLDVPLRRKTSSASQRRRSRASSGASTASSRSIGGYSMTMPSPALPPRAALRKHSSKSFAELQQYRSDEIPPVPSLPSPTISIPPSNRASSSSGPNLNSRETPCSRVPPSRSLPSKSPRASAYSSNSDRYIKTNLSASSLIPATQGYSSNPVTLVASGSSPSLSRTLVSSAVNDREADLAKRKYALLELLATERSYAADLAVVKEFLIPLARGISSKQPSSSISLNPVHALKNTTLFNSSELPMSHKASDIIFGDIEDIAQFAVVFAERLELALGDVLDGCQGKDLVGALFLEMIPQITEKYKMYITRHPAALAQFQSLPQSPALTAYLTETKALASIRTNEWDIPSLLMKPIQRLLLYPLRIGEIISYTPDDHPDKVHLVEAKALIEEIPKAFNEGRKRWEIMKATLTPNSGDGKDVKDRRSGGSNRLSQLRTKVGRMRSVASLNTSSVVDSDLGKEKDEIEEWEKKLKDCEGACKGLAKGSLQLCNDLQFCFKRLKAWATCFERVIGLNEYPLDAVTAFDKVVSGLQTLWVELDNTLLTVLLPQLSKLITSLSSPQTLLAHLHTLYHSHIILLDTPQNKLRSANAILEASQDFLTLIAILCRELPSFFLMFENGLGLILVEFSRWQSRLYQEAKDRWMQFWIALNVADGESKPEEAISDLKVGAEKTIEIWRDRFSEVEELLMSFKTMPHLPLNPLQHQVLLHGSTPPHKLAPIASGIGMYGQEGAFASKSPHGSQPSFNDFKKLHGTPTLRSKYSPPTAPGVPVYMRNASGEIDPLRAKDISLISIVHNNNMPQTKPLRREKLRDSGKESEREQERERKKGIKKEWIAEEQEQRREAKGLLKEERERSALQAVKARLSTLLPSLKERTKTQSSVFRNKVSIQAATMMLSDNSPENTLESTPEVELRELNLGNKTLCGIKIGCGGYSDIFEGTLMFHRDQMKVAIKALRVQGHTGTREADERLRKHFYREILLWRKLRHSNVVPLLGYMTLPDNSPALISPWYVNGNVVRYLKHHPNANRQSLVLDVFNGLGYLHSIPIAHGDLKGENVLVDADGQASLCDSGMSQFLDTAFRITGFTTSNADFGGTDRYMCPELFENMPKSVATDVWALGCLIAQILTDELPYQDVSSKPAVMRAITTGDPPMTNGNGVISPALWSCIKTCWSIKPEDRPELVEIGDRLTSLWDVQAS